MDLSSSASGSLGTPPRLLLRLDKQVRPPLASDGLSFHEHFYSASNSLTKLLPRPRVRLQFPWRPLHGSILPPFSPAGAPDRSSGQRLLNIGLVGKSPEQSAVEAAEGLHYAPYDESALLASRLQQHQISAESSPAGKPMVLQLNHHHQQHQQQMLLQGMGRSPVAASGGDSGLLPLLLSLGSGGSADSRLLVDRSRDEVDHSFKSPDPIGEEGLYNAFGGSLQRVAQAATGSSRSRTLPCRFWPPTSTTPPAVLAKPPAMTSLSIRCSPASPPPGRTSATPPPEPRSRLHLVLGGPSTTKALLRFHPAPASCLP